jgi:hypothetical protein
MQRLKLFSHSSRLFLLIAILGLLPVLPIMIKGSPVLNNDMLIAYFSYFWDFHKNWSWSHPLVFWSSSFQCGMPMHAYWQSGYLYPITWLFFGPLNPLYGIYLFYAFHFSLGIYGFLRLGPWLRLHKPASLWAGICFSLSGTMLARYEHTTFLSGWCWMPLVLAAYLSLREKPGLKTLFFYALSVSLQALGGHPQASITTALLITAYTIADLIRKKVALPKRPILWLFGGHMLAVLYCAPMLIPFLHLVDETTRFDGADMDAGQTSENSAAKKLETGVFGFEKFATGGLRPVHLLSLVAPNILGSPSNASWWGGEVWGEVFLYLGGLGFLFCFFASWKRANRDMRILWIIGLIGLWIAFGKHLGASQILYHLPVLNNFRRPARFVILFVMAIAALSGHGLQVWLAHPRGQRWIGIMVIGSLFLSFTFLIFRLFPSIADQILILIAKFKHLDPQKNYEEKIKLLLGRNALDFAFITLSGFSVWFVARRPKSRLSLLFLVLIGDLIRLHWDHFYLFKSNFYRQVPETAQFLDNATSPFWRVSHYLEYSGLELWQMHNDPVAHFELLEREKLALSHGIHAIFGYRHAGAHLPLIWNWEPPLSLGEKSTRYLFSNRKLNAIGLDSLKNISTVSNINIYEISNWHPRIEQKPVQEKTFPCPSTFSGFNNLCVHEIRDGQMQIMGSFQIGDTLIVRERAYRGWRYRMGDGPWKATLESKDHFLCIPILSEATTVEVNFHPTDFYVLVEICIAVTAFIFFLIFRLP